MPSPQLRRCLTACLTLSVPSLLHAHPGHDGHDLTWDFSGGALHPVAGVDHLLAIVAFGLLLALCAPRLRWNLGAAFLAAMALGGFAGASGLAVPAIEPLIASTVLVLGLLVLAARDRVLLAGAGIAPAFAFLHGVAHGAEIPAHSSGWSYGLGFMSTTAALIGIGIALGSVTAVQSTRARRTVGAVLAGAGVLLLVG